jgi:hypothetical protein
MKLCAVSESLGHLAFPEAAKVSAGLGLAALEIGMGNWPSAPHANLRALLESKDERRRKSVELLKRFRSTKAAITPCQRPDIRPQSSMYFFPIIFAIK